MCTPREGRDTYVCMTSFELGPYPYCPPLHNITALVCYESPPHTHTLMQLDLSTLPGLEGILDEAATGLITPSVEQVGSQAGHTAHG